MRLLFLCHRVPWPADKGEKIRALHILRWLAQRHQVFLAGLIDDASEPESSPLRPLVRELLVQRLRAGPRRLWALGGLLVAQSATTRYFYSSSLQRRVDALIEREGIDVVFCSSSPMAEYVFRSRHSARLLALPRLMDLIDVDSVKWQDYAARSPAGIGWVYRREGAQLARLERRIAEAFDRVLLVSEPERRCFPASAAAAKLQVLPNGVDLEYFGPLSMPTQDAPLLVFTGVMSYYPNVDGVRWFVERIWPQLRAMVPRLRLRIVGSRPVRAIRRLARHPGIELTGAVADVRPHLAQASVCIVPLRIARGIQNKILEAMAMGRPVVATRQAFEGLEAVPGRDLLVASDEADFAAQTVGLLQEPDRAEQIGRQARACVEARYAWSAALQPLEELLPAAGRRASESAVRVAS